MRVTSYLTEIDLCHEGPRHSKSTSQCVHFRVGNNLITITSTIPKKRDLLLIINAENKSEFKLNLVVELSAN